MVGQSRSYGLDPGSSLARHLKKCGSGQPLLLEDLLEISQKDIRNGLSNKPPLVALRL